MHPVHFVIPPQFAHEISVLSDRRLDEDYPYWVGGQFNWVAQTWLVLRQYREGLTFSTFPVSGRINAAHVLTWRSLGARQDEFRVSMRADYPRLFDVDFEILQNPTVALGARQAYLPYWPVPRLIPRDADRRGMKTVAYAGRIGPLNLAQRLRETGLAVGAYEFHIIEPHLWHDMSQIDALIAIRSFDRASHNTKPPSKLFSAWRAGVPLIAGWDSAFSKVGRPGVDYIRVETKEEFHEAVDRLAQEPAYYDAIVEAGRTRASEVSHEAIAKIWLDCLNRQVAPRFEMWKGRGGARFTEAAARLADIARNTVSRSKRLIIPRRSSMNGNRT